VQAIFPRVTFETTPETMEGSAMAPADAIEIVTAGGASLKSGAVEFAKGSHRNPLSQQELWVKFADCLGPAIDDAAKTRAFESLMALDRLNGPGDLALHA